MVPTLTEWLKSELRPGNRIGGDPKLISETEWIIFEREFDEVGLEFVEVQQNLIDLIWKDHYLNNTDKDVYILDVKYAGWY